MSEFKTAREAEDMLRSLHKAARYCTGENSSRRHGERIRQAETEAKQLRAAELRDNDEFLQAHERSLRKPGAPDV